MFEQPAMRHTQRKKEEKNLERITGPPEGQRTARRGKAGCKEHTREMLFEEHGAVAGQQWRTGLGHPAEQQPGPG